MTAVPTETSTTVGQKLTAAFWNTNVGTAINFLLGGASGRKPRLLVTADAGTGLSIANSADTTLKFPTVTIDDDSAWNAATGIYTCATAGVYLFTLAVQWASNATGFRELQIISNGTPTEARGRASGAVDTGGRLSISMLVKLTAGQTVSPVAFQSSGAALSTLTGGKAHFCGVWQSN